MHLFGGVFMLLYRFAVRVVIYFYIFCLNFKRSKSVATSGRPLHGHQQCVASKFSDPQVSTEWSSAI